jgi:hypothetical protein
MAVTDRDLWKVEAVAIGSPMIPFVTPDYDKAYEWMHVAGDGYVFLVYRMQADGVWRCIDFNLA